MKMMSAKRDSNGVKTTVSPRGSLLRSRDGCRDRREKTASPGCDTPGCEATAVRLSGAAEAEELIWYKSGFGEAAVCSEACSVAGGSEV